MNKEIYGKILSSFESIPVIDTHDHLPLNESLRCTDSDFLAEYFTQYIKSDLISAGLVWSAELVKKISDTSIPIKNRWKLISPYWENCRYTGYGRYVRYTLKALYDEDDVCADNIESINERYLKATKPGRFAEILRDTCNIKTSIIDNGIYSDYFENLQTDLFTPVYYFAWMLVPDGNQYFEYLHQHTGVNILNFDSWLEACALELNRICTEKNSKIFKVALAYERSLYFPEPSYADAKKEFDDAFLKIHHKPTFKEPFTHAFDFSYTFQNYMMHYALAKLSKYNAILQFHTGLHEGNWNEIRKSDPLLLTNLIDMYPDIKFDIFHIGYPFWMNLAVLAKNYPNVYINMCWAHIISPRSSISALSEYIDTVPLNKISAFGGDFTTIEQITGHLIMAKQNVAAALTEKVENNIFDIKTAIKIGCRFFYDNPCELYELNF